MADERELKTVHYSTADFIADPTLFERVRQAWENKHWLYLFGEMPDSAVFAELDDGIKFHYKKNP